MYDSSPSGRNRVAYDNSLGDDGHPISIGSRAARKQGARQGPVSDSHPLYRHSKSLICNGQMVPPGIAQTFNDGTPVLKGFVLSAKPVAEDRWFPLPKVPPGWKPDPRRVWDEKIYKENQSTTKSNPAPTQSHAEWNSSLLSADEVSVLSRRLFYSNRP